MAALKAARAFTGRPAIAKVEGTYHGAYDYAEVSQAPGPSQWGTRARPRSVPLAAGTPESVLREVVVLPFNDPEAAVAVLDAHREEIACVLLDLLPHRAGLVPANEAYVRAMRDWTAANGALLVFDEVVTFRNEVGGMQARYSTRPDLTAMGKIIGGGFPIGALAGRADIMDVFAPHDGGPLLPHSGTFSANPVTMTAGAVALELYDADAVARLNLLGGLARARVSEAIAVAGYPATVTGAGSLFRIHLKAGIPTDYRSSYLGPEQRKTLGRFLDEMYRAGILLLNTASGALSTPMTEQDIDRLAEAVLASFRKLEPVRS
jgi:glutamate-1-semialdehyde 2,1-aminomutase